jgi:hypothetical protein
MFVYVHAVYSQRFNNSEAVIFNTIASNTSHIKKRIDHSVSISQMEGIS